MKLNKALIVYTPPVNREEILVMRIVKAALRKHKIKHSIENRERLNKNLFKSKDIIIAVGGDGTFLKASHFIMDKTPMLGVNSNQKFKEGFFMTATKDNFEKKIRKIMNNGHKTRKLQRLEAYIGKKRIPELALNEFYIASEKPYHTARYHLILRNKKERQKSSGILIATAAGSNAWVKSAGGKVLPLSSDNFEYLVREPYCGRISARCTYVNNILNKNEKLEIIFEVGNGILIADSLSKEHRFKSGQKVTIKMSNKPLYSIFFK